MGTNGKKATRICRCGHLDDAAQACSRAIQKARYADINGQTPIRTNAEADGTLLEKIAAPDEAGRTLLADAVRRLHVAEALSFRRVAPNRSAA